MSHTFKLFALVQRGSRCAPHFQTYQFNTAKPTHMSVHVNSDEHHDAALAFALACATDLMTTAFINSSTLHRLTLDNRRLRLRASLRSSRLFSARSTASALRFSKSSFNLDAEASSAASAVVVASPTNETCKTKASDVMLWLPLAARANAPQSNTIQQLITQVSCTLQSERPPKNITPCQHMN